MSPYALLALPNDLPLNPAGTPQEGTWQTVQARVRLGPLTIIAQEGMDLDVTGGYPRLPGQGLYLLHVVHSAYTSLWYANDPATGGPGPQPRRASRLRLCAGPMNARRPYDGRGTKHPTLMITGTYGHQGSDRRTSQVSTYHMSAEAALPIMPYWDKPRHGPAGYMDFYRLLIVRLVDLSGLPGTQWPPYNWVPTVRDPQAEATRAHLRRAGLIPRRTGASNT